MAKRMALTTGLVLGKFMPLHKGHVYLIETAADQVDELTVMLCSIPSEPISGALRYYWLKERFPKLRVIHVTDENPQEPKDHKFFWEIWIDTIRRNCPKGIHKVFTSETYGDTLAKHLNAEHVLVDLKRKTFPVSGTALRNAPFDHWDFVPKIVRPYFIKRVVLTGPESVGKSVLAEQLATHFQTNFVEEYGRTYCEKVGNDDLTTLDFAHIAAGQLTLEDEAALSSNRILFCDTDLVVTQIWAEVFIGNAPRWIYEINHLRQYDLFILLKPDIPWVDDGTRAYRDIRPWQFERLQEELESRNLPYRIVEGDFATRKAQAIAIIEELL
jgi:NadR type nicotinamide-nucleotide adenylyltransferase